MKPIELKKEDRQLLQPFFKNTEETLIYTCIQGHMGSAWADSLTDPRSVQIVVADFCFFAGEISESLIAHRPKDHNSDFIIMVPPDEKWAAMIEHVYDQQSKRVTRYAIKKEPDIFDSLHLQKLVSELNPDYSLKIIDQPLYDMTLRQRWSADLCSQFATYDDYQAKGLGVVALYQEDPVAGASSYTIYNDGIEIEIDTRTDHRRKGLALACGARLILECLQRGLYPSWDAQNWGSVLLAQKLGYHFDKEYTAYEVYAYGKHGSDLC